MQLNVKIKVTEYVPVGVLGSLVNKNVAAAPAGSLALHPFPPPVQAPPPRLMTGRWLELLTVWLPEHGTAYPSVVHVYVRAPAAMLGPPAGLKSPEACTVIAPDPAGVVRALYEIGSVAV